MENIGPVLETLTHRLADTPGEFLAEPSIGGAGKVQVGALVNDVLQLHGARAAGGQLARFIGTSAGADRNRLALVMIAAWLLADDWFCSARPDQAAVLKLLGEGMGELAAANSAHKFIADPDRREELARLSLAWLGFRPEGETVAQATDRLSRISGVERRRLLEASHAAERRAREIRDALARKAAEESADKWSRE